MSCHRHSAPDHLRVGVTTFTPLDGGLPVTRDLVCCVHCGFTFEFGPGMTKGRGWCMRHGGYLCGRPYCRARPCMHWMDGIDNLEAGLPENTPRPVRVSMGGAVLLGR